MREIAVSNPQFARDVIKKSNKKSKDLLDFYRHGLQNNLKYICLHVSRSVKKEQFEFRSFSHWSST